MHGDSAEGVLRRLRSALDAAQIGDWELNLVRQSARRSLRHDQIFGYSELLPEWTYPMFLDHVHPEDRAKVDQTFQASVAAGEDWYFECRIIRADKAVRWIWARGSVFKDESGKATHMLGMVGDITDRKSVEAALRSSEERVRLATEAAGIGVWEWDVKSGALKWDDGMFAMYGLPAPPDGRAAYEDWRERVLPEDVAEQEARLQHTVATCGRDHREFRIVRASDQTVRFIQAAEMVIAGSDGQAARVVGINVDITRRKQAEAQVEHLNADLQHRAAQLEEANKELESFSYSVSHDLRAPLRHIQGFGQMLARATAGQLSEKAEGYLKTIITASAEMGQLIDDLLAFSRMGRAEMRESVVNLNQMVTDTLRSLEMETAGRNIVWKIAPLPPAVGDPAMLRQVFANLIGNSIKYSRQRDPSEIEIGCAGEENGRSIYFVRDNGAGFEMQYAHKLFGVFQRLHRVDQFEGTGIGLATVHRILTRHGDRIWAESELDKGATFYFTLKTATSVELHPESP